MSSNSIKIDILKRAKIFLQNHKKRFICTAIDEVTYYTLSREADALKQLINTRIYPCQTAELWLAFYHGLINIPMDKWRCMWIDLLIKELQDE